MQITEGGLTFLQMKPGKAEVTVWEGEPLESKLVTTATLDGMVMGPEGPAALVEVLDEDLFRNWASEWLNDHPQHRPLTPEQVESQQQLAEIVQDLLNDPDLAKQYEASVGNSEAVRQFVVLAFNQITNVAQAHVIGGMPPRMAAQQATIEALLGCMVAGFVTGKTFQQRGYTL